MKIFLLLLTLFFIHSGCSENNTTETMKHAQIVPIDIDYNLFVIKVKEKQIKSVIIYPKDQIMLATTIEDEQESKLTYSSKSEAANGNQIRTLLLENNIPFTVEVPKVKNPLVH